MKKNKKYSFKYWNFSVLSNIFFLKFSNFNPLNFNYYNKITLSFTLKDFENQDAEQSYKVTYLLQYFNNSKPLINSLITKNVKNNLIYNANLDLIVRGRKIFDLLIKLSEFENSFLRYDWTQISHYDDVILLPQIKLINLSSVPMLADDPNLFRIEKNLILNFFYNYKNEIMFKLTNNEKHEFIKSFISPFFNLKIIKTFY